ncbi:MAG: porin [Acidobacteriota bacterium]
MKKTRLFVGSCLMAIASLAFAQDQTAAPAPAPPAPTWSVGPIDFSGLIDGYYTANFNHPNSGGVPGENALYNFNFNANQMSLSMAKLTMSHDADPVGFRVDLGFGKAFDVIHGSEPSGGSGFLRNIEQAYVSLKSSKGIELDAGQFVTSAGAEVIEAKDDWNYSRSILFAWAIPYYHFGIRTVLPVGSHFTGGFQVVNGWNNVEDNNTGKTMGFVGNFTSSKVSWANDYYTGPENTGTNKGWRNLYDTTVLFTPSSKFNAYLNFDYAKQNNGDGTSSIWTGIAGAAKFQLNDKFAITPRLEWFNDHNGGSTGTAQAVKEFTITAEAKAAQGVLARLEYRYDWSTAPFFQAGEFGAADHQSTLSLGLIAFFGPKH